MPHVLFLGICFVWGASFILMKKAMLAFNPAAVGAWRVAGGAIVLGIVWGLKQRPWPLRREHFWPLLIVAGLGYAWPFAIQPYLVNSCGSGFIGMTVSFVPLFTVLVSASALQVYPSRRQLIGVVGGLFFMALLLADGLDRSVSVGHLVLATTVPLTYALSNTLVRTHFVNVPALAITAMALSMAAVVLVPIGASAPRLTEPSEQVFWQALAAALTLGVIGTGAANWAFNRLVQDHGPLFAGMVTYLVPVGAVLWGWLDQELVTSRQLIALAGILSMVALVQIGAARRLSEPPGEPS